MEAATGKKILIVEDEKPMAHAMERKLFHAGFAATVVNNGEEALAALEKEPFSLVLLDLMMPKMDGFATLEAIRGKGITTPVIILSNLSQQEDEKRARALGANDFLVKSNTPIAGIVDKVTKFL